MSVKSDRIKEKEFKTLSSLKKKQARPEYAGYLILLMCVITLINIVDEVGTSIGGSLQSSIVNEFFVIKSGLTYSEGLSQMSLITTLGSLMMLVIPFYKALADKFGRKALLVISSLGMALGLLICYLSTSFIMYFAGALLLTFFIGHDMQIVYILEATPAKSRARLYSTVKFLGILGMVLIPALRSVFMGSDPTNWRMVYLVPGIMALVFMCLAIIVSRESRVYLDNKIAYLEKPYEERLAEKERQKKQKETDKNKSGVFNAVKYLFSKKDLRWQVVSYIIFFLASASVSMYYESIMTVGGMSTEEITKALFVYPFVYALLTFVSGFIADIIGRKQTVVIFSAISVISFFLFVFGASSGWQPYVMGMLYGLYLGGYWIGCDYQLIMATEKVPTSIRMSAIGAMGLLRFGGIILGLISVTVGLMFTSIGTICLIIAAPCVILSVSIVAFKVKESKGADLSTAGLEEDPQ